MKRFLFLSQKKSPVQAARKGNKFKKGNDLIEQNTNNVKKKTDEKAPYSFEYNSQQQDIAEIHEVNKSFTDDLCENSTAVKNDFEENVSTSVASVAGMLHPYILEEHSRQEPKVCMIGCLIPLIICPILT